MNITYYKKHLKEMKRLLSKTKSKKESIKRNKKILSLEKHIPECQKKIKQLQRREKIHAISGKFKDHWKYVKRSK